MVSLNDDVMIVEICAPDRLTRKTVMGYSSLRVFSRKHFNGRCSISGHIDREFIQFIMTGVSGAFDPWLMFTIDIYYRGSLLFTGTLIQASMKHQGTRQTAYVDLVFEEQLAHVWRRRICQTNTNGLYIPAAIVTSGQKACESIMHDCIGHNASNGGLYASPLDYGRSRDDFGPYWTVTVNFPVNNGGNNLNMELQSGTNALTVLTDIADQTDVALIYEEIDTASWEFSTDTPYMKNDYSSGADAVVLSTDNKTLSAVDYEYDIFAMGDAWFMKGAGSGNGQLRFFIYDTDAADLAGLFENSVTIPGVGDLTALDAYGDRHMALFKSAKIRCKFGITEKAGSNVLFNQTFKVRDKLRIVDSIFGLDLSLTCEGYDINATWGDKPKVSLIFGDPPPSVMKILRQYGGMVGGFSAGEYYANKAG